jgi:hypothetical protein
MKFYIMNAIKKKSKKIKHPHPAPIINDDLDKYLTHPVVLKKMERGRKMMGIK